MPIPLIFRKLKPALHESVMIQQCLAGEKDKGYPPEQRVLEVDVPDNGGCLFYAVIFGYLLPVLNEEAFGERYRALFGEDKDKQPCTSHELQNLLRRYNGDPQFIRDQIILEQAINLSLRARVVEYMKKENFDVLPEIAADEANAARIDNDIQASKATARTATENNIKILHQEIDSINLLKEEPNLSSKDLARLNKESKELEDELAAQLKALNHKNEEKPSSSLNLTPEEKKENYYKEMQILKTEGGENELIALSKMLNAKIVIYKPDQKGMNPFTVYGKDNRNSIYLAHVNINQQYAQVDQNHYHFLVTPESFYPNLYSAQQERKSRDRQRFALLAVVSSIVLPIISLVFLLPLWSRLKKNEMKNEKLKLLDTTEDVIKQVKERRNAWKAHILKREDNLHLGEANPHRKVEFSPAEANIPANPQQKLFIVDEKKYERFTLFRDTPLETLQSDNTLEEKHRTSKKESTTILNEFKRPQ